jgi:NAD(P)H dehydrogenase (quinone)
MYIVTGTTHGRMGISVLRKLAGFVSPSQVAISKQPSWRDMFPIPGFEIRTCDFNSLESLKASFAGGQKLLLFTTPSLSDRTNQGNFTVINAGIKHVVLTSQNQVDHESVSKTMNHSRCLEDYLKSKANDIKYTIVRPGLVCEKIGWFLGETRRRWWRMLSDKEFRIPGDGKIAWSSRSDSSAGIAKILTSDGYENATVNLTGDKAYTLAESSAIIGQIFNLNLTTKIVSPGEYISIMKETKLGPETEQWVNMYAAISNGDYATVSPALQQLVGPLESHEDALNRMLVEKAPKVDQEARQEE